MVRRYKRGDLLTPVSENMFWESYRVMDYVASGGKYVSRSKIGYTYFLECYPKDTELFNSVIMQVSEISMDALMKVSVKNEEQNGH